MALFCPDEITTLCTTISCEKKAKYCLRRFKTLVESGEWYFFNTRRPKANLENLDWDDNRLEEVLLGMNGADWQKTVSDCLVHDLPGYRVIDADQYEVHWDEEAKMRKNDPWSTTVSLSMKIAIVDDENGICAGVVTFHISG